MQPCVQDLFVFYLGLKGMGCLWSPNRYVSCSHHKPYNIVRDHQSICTALVDIFCILGRSLETINVRI